MSKPENYVKFNIHNEKKNKIKDSIIKLINFVFKNIYIYIKLCKSKNLRFSVSWYLPMFIKRLNIFLILKKIIIFLNIFLKGLYIYIYIWTFINITRLRFYECITCGKILKERRHKHTWGGL